MTINEKALEAAHAAVRTRLTDPTPDAEIETVRLAITAYLSALGSEPVAWQRRARYEPYGPGSIGFWAQCPELEATGFFERNPLFEYRPLYAAHPAPAIPDVDTLAQIIRRVNGDNTFGAGALAEAIIGVLAAAPEAPHE